MYEYFTYMNILYSIGALILSYILYKLSSIFSKKKDNNINNNNINNINNDKIIQLYNKNFQNMFSLFNKEIKKSLNSIIQFNKQYVMENNYINLRNSLFTKDIEKKNILIDSITIKNQATEGRLVNTNNYTFMFDDNNIPVFKNVIGFRFIESSMIVPPDNVNDNNNIIKFNIGSDKTATLTNGSYSNDELATELKDALDTAATGTNFTVTFDENTHKFNIKNTTFDFKFLWASSNNSSWKLFGFDNIDATSSTDYGGDGLTSDNAIDQSFHFVDLVIPEIPSIACKKNSIGKNVVERMTVTGARGNLISYRSNITEYYSQNYFFPIKLDKISIQLFNESSNSLYDTGNYNNYFEFEVTIIKNTKDFNKSLKLN